MGADVHRLALAPADTGRAERRFRPGSFGLGDASVLCISALSAFAVTWLAFSRIAPLQSGTEFCLVWYLLFMASYWFVVRELDGPVMAGDRTVGVLVASAAIAMVVPLALIMAYVVEKGMPGLTLHFFTETQEFAGPLSSVTTGGAEHAIVGTLEQVGLAVLMSVPLGFMCAVFLNEIGGPLERPVRVFVDAMSGVPTIVAGIFVYSVWVFEFGFSGFAASLAISISMLPIVTRTSEEVLRLVPEGLREASLALGTSEWRTVWSVVLPTARSGLITAVILGVARAIGETAPLIATAFGASVMNANPFQGPQSALPLFIFKLLTESAQPNVIGKAWTGCLVLMLMVLVLFTIARLVGSGALARLNPGRLLQRGDR
jgi:phosphate transport system permease protein